MFIIQGLQMGIQNPIGIKIFLASNDENLLGMERFKVFIISAKFSSKIGSIEGSKILQDYEYLFLRKPYLYIQKICMLVIHLKNLTVNAQIGYIFAKMLAFFASPYMQYCMFHIQIQFYGVRFTIFSYICVQINFEALFRQLILNLIV